MSSMRTVWSQNICSFLWRGLQVPWYNGKLVLQLLKTHSWASIFLFFVFILLKDKLSLAPSQTSVFLWILANKSYSIFVRYSEQSNLFPLSIQREKKYNRKHKKKINLVFFAAWPMMLMLLQGWSCPVTTAIQERKFWEELIWGNL